MILSGGFTATIALMLATVVLLLIGLATMVDNKGERAPLPASNDDTADDDDDAYLTLMLKHGDDISSQLARYVERAKAQVTDSSSDDYKRFVQLLQQLYDEYEVQPTTTEDVNQSDDPGVLMFRDDLSNGESQIDRAKNTVDKTVPEPLRSQLDTLLSRGRKLLAYYRDLMNKARAKESKIDELNRQMSDLERERHDLGVSNDQLRWQLELASRKTEQLQTAYDDADRKLADLNTAYEQQARELREDEQRLQQMERECHAKSSELEQVVSQRSTSNQQIDQLQQTLREKNDSESRLQQEIDRKSTEFEGKSREQQASCQRLRDELERAITENRSDVETVRGQLAAAETRLADEQQQHRREISELEQQIQSGKRDLEVLASQLKTSQEKTAYEEQHAQQLQQDVNRLKELLANTVKQFDQKVENVDDAAKLVDTLKGQCKLYQDSLSEEKSQLEQAQSRLTQYEKQVADVERKLDESRRELDDRLAELQQERGEFVAYKQRFNSKSVERMRNEMQQRLQQETNTRLDCVRELGDKSNQLFMLQAKFDEQQEQLTNAMKNAGGKLRDQISSTLM